MHKLPGVVALNSWALTVVWSRYLPKSSGICDGGLGGSHTLPMPETTPPTVVAGAAIFDDRGRLLSARRTLPLHVAGKWEFPGGKVEEGETDLQGLHREIMEELGVEITVGEQVGADWQLGPNFVLRLWKAQIISGEPQPLEDHDILQWLEPGHWFDVDWLPADLPIVQALVDELAAQ